MPKGLPWFRFYSASLNSAKVQKLTDRNFRAWIGALCIASEFDGLLPDMAEIAFRLRVKPSQAAEMINALKDAKLLDTLPDNSITPHDWNEHQFVTDRSTERVRKHREKRFRNVSETASEQSRAEQIQSRAETEQKQSERTGVRSEPASPTVWPLTLAAVRQASPDPRDPPRFPLADRSFVNRLAAKAIERAPGFVITDQALADAVIEAAEKSPKQRTHGMFLTTVPEVIEAWAQRS